jgi:hypothetical protein
MILYRASGPDKVEWTHTHEHARSIAMEWARSAMKYKTSGTFAVDKARLAPRLPDFMISFLNGSIPLFRKYLIHIEAGKIIRECEWKNARQKINMDPVMSAAHPTFRHSDWIKTIHSIDQYQALLRSAPDPKSALIACKLAGIDKSSNGFPLTPSICRYIWEWINSTPK